MSDLISRQAAIDAVYSTIFDFLDIEKGELTRDDRRLFEINKAITTAIRWLPASDRWHRITCRPMDEEERKYWSELRGYTLEDDEAIIYSGTPDDGDEVLVCTAWGNVYIDTFYSDTDDGCYFEGNGDMDGIVAWMPKPEPYKVERREDPSHPFADSVMMGD